MFLKDVIDHILLFPESAIKGGEVSATAQGRKNGGTAQTQVSGTYTGKGSFSATAQTSDKDRSVEAQVIFLKATIANKKSHLTSIFKDIWWERRCKNSISRTGWKGQISGSN